MTVYVFGNGNIPFEEFLTHYAPLLDKVCQEKDHHFLLCDFIGQSPRYFPDKYRTKTSQWKVSGGFKSDQERDQQCMDECTHFLARDYNSTSERMSGTQRNILGCLSKGKIELVGQTT